MKSNARAAKRAALAVALFLALVAWLPLDARDVPPPLVEVEQLRVENLRLEGVIIQQELQQWQAKRTKLKADLENVRPGWLWNPDTNTFTEKPK